MNKPIKYEVAIFNKDVRQQVKIGEKHKDFTDDWADMHYIVVTAVSEQDARAKISARYPATKGFVIEQVSKAMEE